MVAALDRDRFVRGMRRAGRMHTVKAGPLKRDPRRRASHASERRRHSSELGAGRRIDGNGSSVGAAGAPIGCRK
jgi:hypothetical protein